MLPLGALATFELENYPDNDDWLRTVRISSNTPSATVVNHYFSMSSCALSLLQFYCLSFLIHLRQSVVYLKVASMPQRVWDWTAKVGHLVDSWVFWFVLLWPTCWLTLQGKVLVLFISNACANVHLIAIEEACMGKEACMGIYVGKNMWFSFKISVRCPVAHQQIGEIPIWSCSTYEFVPAFWWPYNSS